jgi:tetratricopeptide (TPR) repeat protein
MADHDHNQSLPPEEDARIAQEVFQRGEIEHALFHLSFSLAHNPEHPEWLPLLDRILDAGGNSPDVLQPAPGSQIHFSHAAVLAYIFARRGDYDRAVSIMTDVHSAVPEPVYLPWVTRWLSQPANLSQIDVVTLNAFIARTTSRVPGSSDENPAVWQRLETFLPALDVILKHFPGEGFMNGIISTIFRKLGQHKRALEIAQHAYNTQPTDMTAVFLSGVYRVMGDTDQAVALLQKALQHNPTNYQVRMDIADILVDAGKIKEGLPYYEEVLKV